MPELILDSRAADALGETVTLEWYEGGPRSEQAGPVVVLHGERGPDTGRPWLAHMAEHRRVIAPVHPGYGETPRPDWMDTITDLAHFYLELLDAQDLEDVTLLGTSLGGWIAAEMAAWRRQRVGRLILVGAVGIRIGYGEGRDLADIYAMSREERDAVLVSASPEVAGPPLAELPRDEVARRVRAEESTALYCWEPYMCNPKLKRRLNAVDRPALVVCGSGDRLVGPEYGQALAGALPDARLEVIDDAGHSPHLDQPQRFGDVVEAFIAATSS